MISMFMLTTACEKSTDHSQVSVLDQNKQITPREEADCSICPLECCCCGIEMVGFGSFTLEICGLCEGDYLCGPYSADPPCSTVSGIGQNFTFFLPNQARHTFCVEPGASIRIRNASPGIVNFRFTCEPHLSPPPYVNVTLVGIGDEAFFYNNGSCMVAGCP